MNEVTVRLNEAKSLPEGWRWVKLQDLLDLYDSGLWGIQDPLHGLLVIRSVNFRNDGSISTKDIAKIMPNTSNPQNKRLSKGDILLERSGGGPKQPVGRVALFDFDGEFYFGNFISRLRCKADVDSNFLFLHLHSAHLNGVTIQLQDQTTGIRNLRFAEYLQLRVPLPPLPEQKRIAAKVQELMKEAEHAYTTCGARLEAAKALPQAYLRQVFESGEAKNWERWRLGEIAVEFVNGGTPSTEVTEYWGGDIPWITGADVTNLWVSRGRKFITKEGLDNSATHLVNKGTILIVTRTGVGKVGITANAL
jgi:type I restriction enzyme S subunit